MDRPRFVLLALIAIVMTPVEGWGQREDDNPHGVLPKTLDCKNCHTPTSWRPARIGPEFDHDGSTPFALLGRHQEANCRSCHIDLRFDEPDLRPTECGSCHVDVHRNKFTAECVACHNTIDFADIPGLSIHSRTAFPLTGSHLQISCESCHTDDSGGAYSTLSTDCVSCHESDYAAARSPDHVTAGLPTNCEACHGTLLWSGDRTFDHVAASGGFLLTGAHASISCDACHVLPGNELRFPPPASQTDCIACHQDDYDRQHGGSGQPTDCLQCHDDLSWEGSTFDHTSASNGFALVGAHALLSCESCHIEPGNELRFPAPSSQTDCIACHQAEYDSQHGGSGFSTSCLDCHTVDSWQGATFDHDPYFPIYSGIHSNNWKDCETCHIDPANRQVFTCFNCHQHSQDRMDSRHAGVSDYVYDSNACYSCHPDARVP